MRRTIAYSFPGLFLVWITGYTACAPGNEKANTAGDRDCISYIMGKDSVLGGLRNKACESMPLTGAITQYVTAIEALDFSDCPDSFTRAFQHHISAWIKMQAVTAKYPGLRGEMHALFSQLAHSPDSIAFNQRLKEIWDSWADVEKAMHSLRL